MAKLGAEGGENLGEGKWVETRHPGDDVSFGAPDGVVFNVSKEAIWTRTRLGAIGAAGTIGPGGLEEHFPACLAEGEGATERVVPC